MKTLQFNDYYILLIFLINCYSTWRLFFLYNSYDCSQHVLPTDLRKIKQVKKKPLVLNFLVFDWNLTILTLLTFFTFRGVTSSFWWNHFYLSSAACYCAYFLVSAKLVMLACCFLNVFSASKLSKDFFFAFSNISNFIPLLFFVANVFSFVIVLELCSISFYYKFITTQSKATTINGTKSHKKPNTPFFNLIFFQYWASFFSSIFFFFFLGWLFYVCLTSDYSLISIIFNKLAVKGVLFEPMILFVFVFAFLFKLGLAPVHLFKLEVYKGLPLQSILFYTTFYFWGFYAAFIWFFINVLQFVANEWWIAISLLLLAGGVYSLSLFFNVLAVKAFFAYSTIFNVFLFTVCILALKNI